MQNFKKFCIRSILTIPRAFISTSMVMKSIIFDKSEMAKKIREFDWSQTPVGSIENWPQSLQLHVNSLLTNLLPIILFWGDNFTICAYNDAYRPLLGQKPEALGRPFLEVWQESAEIIKPKIEQTLQGEACYFKNASFELVRHGKPYQAYFDYCFSPIRDEKGSIKGGLNMAVEVTEQKLAKEALREKETQFRDAFAYAPVGMIITDLEGRFLHVNEAYCRITSYSEQELLQSGLNFQQLIHPNDLGKNLEELRRIKAGEIPAFFLEKRYLRKDGTTAWVRESVSLHRHPKGKNNEIVGLVEDITERKRAEDTSQNLNKTLEQKMIERTQVAKDRAKNLQTLVGELTFADQKERQRLAKILHDHLQQLLVGARINSEILCRSAGGKHKKIAKNVFDLISQSIQTSRSLTAELYPPVLQQGLSASLQWTARWMNENHGLTIDLQTDPDIDPKQEDVTAFLYQSTRELLLNVIKHSGVKSARVEMTCDEEQNQLRVTVSDHGSGFDQGAVLKNEGIGFDLFSIQERLQLMGGSIRIESSPGNGASLSLIVPLEKEEEKKDEAIREIKTEDKITRTGEDKIRTLVVDDHTVVRQGISAMLSFNSDIEMVGEAGDGQEAVEKARQLYPDVILMDINMPRMDGIQATRIIHSELPYVRIIGLSMHDKQDQADQMIQAGASAYCTKDGSTDELLSAIRRVD